MRLSTKSRYGTRLMLDLAEHHGQGAVQLSDIAKRQKVSQKYLEQIIKPLRKAGFINSIRGAKGGYVLSRTPRQITVGEIVALLEGGPSICECSQDPKACERAETCLTRRLWIKAAKAMFDELHAITFFDLMRKERRRSKGSRLQKV